MGPMADDRPVLILVEMGIGFEMRGGRILTSTKLEVPI